MKKFILFSALALLGGALTAQDDKIENFKKDFLLKELELTPQEAEAFFPIYNEYSGKRKEARRSLRREMQNLNTDAGNSSVDKLMDKEQDMVDLQKEYLDKFRKVIPEKKVIKLLEAEKKFKMMLLQKLRG
jgi:predicted DNA-binding transcriptional regulator YafY